MEVSLIQVRHCVMCNAAIITSVAGFNHDSNRDVTDFESDGIWHFVKNPKSDGYRT